MREPIDLATAQAAFGSTVSHCSDGKVVVQYRIVTSRRAERR